MNNKKKLIQNNNISLGNCKHNCWLDKINGRIIDETGVGTTDRHRIASENSAKFQ